MWMSWTTEATRATEWRTRTRTSSRTFASYGDNVGSGTGVERTCSSSASTESVNSVETRGFSEVGAGSAYVPTGESVGDLSELLDSAAVRDGLEAFASTPRPPTSGRPIEPTPSLSCAASTITVVGGGAGSEKMQGTQEAQVTWSARPIQWGGNIFEMMLMMREENECKADARRMDEEQRRRYELAAREAHYHTEKAEAEERYRQEKLESEERARCDKEEGRAPQRRCKAVSDTEKAAARVAATSTPLMMSRNAKYFLYISAIYSTITLELLQPQKPVLVRHRHGVRESGAYLGDSDGAYTEDGHSEQVV
ncbi:hypothetical protein ON010_g1897 [Phytophthora cinnamomi]|nr:hypothetical protein ON010_g1897 [Phytophthora cinnamomi]